MSTQGHNYHIAISNTYLITTIGSHDIIYLQIYTSYLLGNLCEKENSNCEQFCYNLNQPSPYIHCGCEDGKELEEQPGGNLTCVDGDPVPEWKCPAGQFLCNNKRCINEQFVCDNENDCFDNSDEEICKYHFIQIYKYLAG